MNDHHTMCPHCGQLIGDKPARSVCDECGGRGYVIVSTGGKNWSGVMQRQCSKGCPPQYTVNFGMGILGDLRRSDAATRPV